MEKQSPMYLDDKGQWQLRGEEAENECSEALSKQHNDWMKQQGGIMENKTGFTKGERHVVCGDDYWFVVDEHDNTIGRFSVKEEALLDAAAPELYKALASILQDAIPNERLKNALKALFEAEGK